MIPEKLGNKVSPKRHTWISLGRGNREGLLKKNGSMWAWEEWEWKGREGEKGKGEEHEGMGCLRRGKDREGEKGKRYLD